jgi:hypothetical protein
MMNRTQRLWAAAAGIACGLLMTFPLHAADPGELFPNVGSYDETVVSPISKPEQSITQKEPPVVEVPIPAQPPAPPEVIEKPPEPTPQPANDSTVKEPGEPNEPARPPRRKPTRITRKPNSTQPTTAPPPPPLVELTPDAAGNLTPMLAPEEQRLFTTDYAEPITKALAGSVVDRKKTADLLESAADGLTSPSMKRYVLLHAFALYIRASTPLAERVQKAEVLLPMLSEHTLPVVQARADALNDLMVTASSNPNERFMDLYIEAHAMLAKLQVQAGYPKDAQDSLHKARDVALRFMRKPQARIDQINEAAAWCDRATAAAALWPKYQATLKTSPNDPVTNTQVATLHLSLYGNLAQAAVFAARSDRKDLKAFAEVIKANPPQALSNDPTKHAEQVLAISAALVDVAKATPVSQTFDRYSIACYAGDHVEQLIADGVVPSEKALQSRALLASAKDVVDRTRLKRGDDLPKWLGGSGSTTNPAAKPIAGRTIANFADVFHGMPKDLAPTTVGWSRKQLDDVNEWMQKNVVGQTFSGNVFFKQVRPAVETPEGKMYVPIVFGVRDIQVNDNFVVVFNIENDVPPKLAGAARNRIYWAPATVKGTISDAQVRNQFGDSRRAELTIVITTKE